MWWVGQVEAWSGCGSEHGAANLVQEKQIQWLATKQGESNAVQLSGRFGDAVVQPWAVEMPRSDPHRDMRSSRAAS
jgi:hypothetical protein